MRAAADAVRGWLFGAAPRGESPDGRQVLDEVHDLLFAKVWGDETLPPRERSLLTIAALVAQGREQQLRTHFRVALRLGVSPSEINAAITHLALYVGVAAANTAFSLAQEIITESADGPP